MPEQGQQLLVCPLLMCYKLNGNGRSVV
jgi:hypothetical protein